jgi:hypothetical protein
MLVFCIPITRFSCSELSSVMWIVNIQTARLASVRN